MLVNGILPNLAMPTKMKLQEDIAKSQNCTGFGGFMLPALTALKVDKKTNKDNMPKSALGKRMALAMNTLLRYLSSAMKSPMDTARCNPSLACTTCHPTQEDSRLFPPIISVLLPLLSPNASHRASSTPPSTWDCKGSFGFNSTSPLCVMTYFPTNYWQAARISSCIG